MAERLKKGWGKLNTVAEKRGELSRQIHLRRDSLSPQYTWKSDLRKKRKEKK
jgi:hypothetical protein